MKYANNILGLIGNTPMVKLNDVAKDLKPLILAKLEYLNPGGSSKDRIAVSMLDQAEKDGLLKPGGTVVEPTSGNTGVGLAMVCKLRGYQAIFTMPDKMSMEKQRLLEAYGAKVLRCPTAVEPEDPKSYYSVAKQKVTEIEGAFSPNQYFNQNNPKAHYVSTGPEIWEDTEGKITHFVAGMGTGGTISGTAKYLKEKNPNIKIIGADTEGSLYSGRFYGTEEVVHSYLIEGIGEDFMPETMDLSAIDEVLTVTDKDAYEMTRKLTQSEALLGGSSAGAAVVAALEYAKNLTEDDVMVVFLPDSGRSYLSTVYNDNWMKENKLMN
ncbi:MAG: pyridoxal-phosphate dependent enzyme [Flavobacteriales bacterium]|jgi:cystathionine beta-synthase|nr:pyridoxal-phosphate dependent enzyme [Flavobacteriales bacterium]